MKELFPGPTPSTEHLSVEARSIRDVSFDYCFLLTPHGDVARHNLSPKSSCDKLKKLQLPPPYQQCLAQCFIHRN